MSVSSSRSSIRRVEGATAASASASGAVLLGTLLSAAFGSPRSIKMRRRATTVLPSVLLVRSEIEIEQSIQGIGHCDTTRLAEVATAEPLAIAVRPVDVERAVAALGGGDRANNRIEAIRELTNVAISSHKDVMREAAVEACRVASAAVGFGDIQVVRSAESAIVRIVADDPAGHSLVSEIRCTPVGLCVDTEIIGVTDGSCVTTMSRFDTALKGAGLRSEPAKQRLTGGVCELEFSKALVRERWKDRTRPKAKAAPRNQRTMNRRGRMVNVGGQR